MFIGAINADLRGVVALAAKRWGDAPVYVGCSGAFTIERVLTAAGHAAPLHGNDVSLYSCAFGHHLAGRPFRLAVKDPDYAWLADDNRLDAGLPALATLQLATAALPFAGRPTPYHRRTWEAYRTRWASLHAATVARVEKALAGVTLASFRPGDAVAAHVARLADFPRLIDALDKAKCSFDVHNSAVALGLVLDVFEHHRTDLAAGWLDHESDPPSPRHKKPVPVATVLGDDLIPSALAVALAACLRRHAKASGGKASACDTLAAMAALYLKGDESP